MLWTICSKWRWTFKDVPSSLGWIRSIISVLSLLPLKVLAFSMPQNCHSWSPTLLKHFPFAPQIQTIQVASISEAANGNISKQHHGSIAIPTSYQPKEGLEGHLLWGYLHWTSLIFLFFNMFHQCFTYFRFTSLAHLAPSPHIWSPGICLWLLGCDHGGNCCAPNHMGPPNSLRVRSWRHPGEADRSWQNAGKPWVEGDKHDIKWHKMTTWYTMLLFCCHLCRLRPFMAHCVIMVCEAFGPSVFYLNLRLQSWKMWHLAVPRVGKRSLWGEVKVLVVAIPAPLPNISSHAAQTKRWHTQLQVHSHDGQLRQRSCNMTCSRHQHLPLGLWKIQKIYPVFPWIRQLVEHGVPRMWKAMKSHFLNTKLVSVKQLTPS